MATRIPALIFDGIVEIGCLFFLYLVEVLVKAAPIHAVSLNGVRLSPEFQNTESW